MIQIIFCLQKNRKSTFTGKLNWFSFVAKCRILVDSYSIGHRFLVNRWDQQDLAIQRLPGSQRVRADPNKQRYLLIYHIFWLQIAIIHLWSRYSKASQCRSRVSWRPFGSLRTSGSWLTFGTFDTLTRGCIQARRSFGTGFPGKTRLPWRSSCTRYTGDTQVGAGSRCTRRAFGSGRALRTDGALIGWFSHLSTEIQKKILKL